MPQNSEQDISQLSPLAKELEGEWAAHMAEVFQAFLPTALAQNVIHSNLQASMKDLVCCHADVESAEVSLHAIEVARGMGQDLQPWESMS